MTRFDAPPRLSTNHQADDLRTYRAHSAGVLAFASKELFVRIAYLTSQYPAPSHTFIRREVNALRARGVDILTYSIRSPGQCVAPEDLLAKATTFYILPTGALRVLRAHTRMFARAPRRYLRTLRTALEHRVPGGHAFVYALFYFAESMILAEDLLKNDVEHLHNHFANASATVGFLSTRYLGLPWSLTLHAYSETDYPAGQTLGAKLKAADFANAVCHYTRAQVYRTIPSEHWGKIEIVRCGVNLRELPPDRATRTPGSPLRIICVARLAREKGHYGLLRAFARTRPQFTTELVLVGDGPERAGLEREASDLRLSSCVRFLGALPEHTTLQEIASSDILVLASLIEGLPVVLLEAMAMGVPVIAPNVAGIPELIEDNRNGLLFPPSDWDSLYDRLDLLMRDEDLRSSLAQAGRFEVEARFQLDHVVEPMVERFRGKSLHSTHEGATVLSAVERPTPIGIKQRGRKRTVMK